MKASFKTDIGIKRTENQDKVWGSILPGNAMSVIVCDGMGGEKAGSVASDVAINIISQRILSGFRENIDGNSIRNLLISALVTANSSVFELANSDPEKKGMGTTCVAAIVYNERAYIVNVGDSRAYCICGNQIKQITKDHTIVRMLVEQGKITEDDIKEHPQRSYITRAVGVENRISSDYFELDLYDDDILLLCTDGLTSYCDEEEIRKIVIGNSIETACDVLIKYANDQGGSDNITVALISND